MKITDNFNLIEFIESDFFGEHQDKVLESFRENESVLMPNLQKLAEQLQILRDYTGLPIKINIAYRPKWWEIKQGRSGSSQHVLCKAADIVIIGLKPSETYDLIERLVEEGSLNIGGLGKYNSFTHIDVRENKARW